MNQVKTNKPWQINTFLNTNLNTDAGKSTCDYDEISFAILYVYMCIFNKEFPQ